MSSFLVIPSKKIKDLEQLKATIIREVQIIAADTVLLKKFVQAWQIERRNALMQMEVISKSIAKFYLSNYAM